MNTSHWTYFTSAIGICWITVFFIQLFTGPLLLGLFLSLGILLFAILYTYVRRHIDANGSDLPADHPNSIDPELMATFLACRPEYTAATAKQRYQAVNLWLDERIVPDSR